MSCYPEADLTLWNAAAFGSDFDELVAKPAAHAAALLQGNVYLTRMLTRISPAEMTEDPMFREWTEPLADVSNQLGATRMTRCDGTLLTATTDGREVAGASAPGDLPAGLPWASRVEEYTLSGEYLLLSDNDAEISSVLTDYNHMVAPGSEPSATSASHLGPDTNGACGCALPARRASHGIILGLLAALGVMRRLARVRRAPGA